MEIKLEDLEVGDEILISSGSRLKYLKVLRPIKEKGFNTHYNRKIYKSVYCSARKENIIYYTGMRNGKPYDWKKDVYLCTPEHNVEIYQNLNGKTIWLIKRERE